MSETWDLNPGPAPPLTEERLLEIIARGREHEGQSQSMPAAPDGQWYTVYRNQQKEHVRFDDLSTREKDEMFQRLTQQRHEMAKAKKAAPMSKTLPPPTETATADEAATLDALTDVLEADGFTEDEIEEMEMEVTGFELPYASGGSVADLTDEEARKLLEADDAYDVHFRVSPPALSDAMAERLDHIFRYHKPSEDDLAKYEAIRAAGKRLATGVFTGNANAGHRDFLEVLDRDVPTGDDCTYAADLVDPQSSDGYTIEKRLLRIRMAVMFANSAVALKGHS